MSHTSMSQVTLRGSLEWALMVTLIFAGGAIAKAQSAEARSAEAQNESSDQSAVAPSDEQPPGKIVRIGPAGDAQITLDESAVDDAARLEPPRHWIGILCGPVSEELRAQIDLPADHGVLVRQVVPGSPADKAGLKPFDILLTANDEKLSDAAQLTDLVRSQGASGEKISLDVLRRGEHLSIALTPEARPDVPDVGSRMPTPVGPGPQAWHLNPRDPLSYNFRSMPGPRTMPGMNWNQMPSGVSVSVQKQTGAPAHIIVKRGNDTWDIVGDDPSSLAQLPEDLRPFVEQMLAGTQAGQVAAMPQMPMMPGMGPPAGFRNGELQQRLDLMQQQLEELQQRMRDQIDALDTEGTPADDGAASDPQ